MTKKVDKPIRLYVFTIFLVLGYGVMPLVSVFPAGRGLLLLGPRFLPFNGSVYALFGDNGDISTVLLIVTLLLSFGTVGAAIVTFLGVREAKWPTLILLTLDVGWWFFLVVSAIMNADDTESTFSLGTQLLFPPFWLALVWWNWTRTDISAWLNYRADLEN